MSKTPIPSPISSLAALDSMQAILRKLGAAQDLQRLYALAAEEAAAYFKVAQSNILLYDPSSGLLRVQPPLIGLDEAQAEILAIAHTTQIDFLAKQWPEQGAVRLFSPEFAHLIVPELVSHLNERDVLLALMRIEGQVIGELRIANKLDGGLFTEEDVHLLGLYAGQLGLLIHSLRLLEQEQSARHLAETLLKVPQVVQQPLLVSRNDKRSPLAPNSTESDLQGILTRLLTLLGEVIDYSGATVALLEGERLRIITSMGHSLSEAIIGYSWPAGTDPKVTAMQAGGGPIVISDTTQDPRWLMFGPPEIRSWLGVPIWAPGGSRAQPENLIGTLNIDANRTAAFTERDLAVAQAFADQMAIVLENQRLYAGMARRVAELDALRETLLAVTVHQDVDKLLKIIVEHAVALLRAKGGDICQVDEVRGLVQVVAECNIMPSMLGTAVPTGTGPAGRVAQSGQPQLIRAHEGSSGSLGLDIPDRYGALAAVPLRWQKHVLGVLTVMGDEGDRVFTQDDIDLLSLFADQAAIALANAQAYAQVRGQAALMGQLLEARNRLRLQLDQAETAQAAAEIVRDVLRWRQVLVSLRDEQNLYRAAALVGYDDVTVEQLRGQPPRPLDPWYRQPEFQISRSYLVDSRLAKKTGPETRTYARSVFDGLVRGVWQDESILIVPMLAGGREVGYFSVSHPESGVNPGRSDIEALEIFASQVAIALENARLFDQTQHHLQQAQRRSRELALLNQVSAAINSAMTLDEVLDLILSQLRRLARFTQASIALLDGSEFVIVGAAGFPPGTEVVGRHYPLDRFRLNVAVIEGGKPISIPDVLTDPRWTTAEGGRPVRGWMGVPLAYSGHVSGLLVLTATQPTDYSAEEEQVVAAVAERAALAIEKARLLDELQRHLDTAERRSQDLALINRISGHLSASLAVDEILRNAVTELAQAVNVQQAGLVLLDWDKGYGRMVAEYQQQPNETGQNEILIPMAGNLSMARVLETAAPLAIHDAQHDPLMTNVHDVMAQRGVKSILLLPLIVQGKVIGTIGLDELAKERDFTAAEIELAQTITNQAAAAITNAQLYEDIKRRAIQLQTIQEVTTRIGTILDPAELLMQMTELVAQRCNYSHVHAFVVDPSRQHLVAMGGSGPVGRRMVADQEQLPIDGQGLCAWSTRTGEVALVNDVCQDERHASCDYLVDTRSEITVPMKIGGRVVGLLDVQSPHIDAFDSTDRFLIETLADQVAVALENARLYETIQERAEQLARAYEELKALDRMKDEFVQTVSHELRTPLTFIKGYIELLLEGIMGELNAEQVDALQIVAQRTENVVNLVSDIISLTRADSVELELETVQIGEVAQASVQGAQAVTERAGLELTADVPPDLPAVLGDVQRLTQVFDNLIGNAIKFSPNGGQIDVRLRSEGHFVRVEISDHGIGIPAEQLPRVWERFYQVDSTTTRRFGGTGLGLAIVKRLVEAHGGQVGAISTVGQGSTFFFTIPRAAERPQEYQSDHER